METLIVIALVAGAVVFLWPRRRRPPSGDCGAGCGGCRARCGGGP